MEKTKGVKIIATRKMIEQLIEEMGEKVLAEEYSHTCFVPTEHTAEVTCWFAERSYEISSITETEFIDLRKVEEKAYYRINFSFRKNSSKIYVPKQTSNRNQVRFAYVRKGKTGRVDYVISVQYADAIQSMEKIEEAEAKQVGPQQPEKKGMDAFQVGDCAEITFRHSRKMTCWIVDRTNEEVEIFFFRPKERKYLNHEKVLIENIYSLRLLSPSKLARFQERLEPFQLFERHQSKISAKLLIDHFSIQETYNRKEKTLTITRANGKEKTFAIDLYSKDKILHYALYQDEGFVNWIAPMHPHKFIQYIMNKYVNHLRNIVAG